jgi:hypothetical protein
VPEPTATLTKVCPRCAETIKAAAKVCPFCQGRLGRWAGRPQEVLLVVCGVVLLAAWAWWFERIWPNESSPGRAFEPYRAQLVVYGLSLGPADSRSNYWLSGFVSNGSPHPWRVHQLEVRFLSGGTNLLEVQRPLVETPFVVQAGHEAAFRANLGRLPPAIRQAALVARVHEAIDAHRPPPD